MQSLLEAEHLRKSYDRFLAVNDLSLHVDAGEVFGLIGPNGAGKTTTMMMVTGLLRPDSGTVRILGKTFDEGGCEIRKLLGVVPQDLAIYPELTARENLRFFGQLYHLHGAALKQRVGDVLDRIGLSQNADALSKTFSGGMKRRLNFGVALMHEPRLVVLDEPTVGVDPQSRTHLLDAVRALSDSGVGVVYATHYMEEIEAICQRVAIVDHGQMLALGSLDQLLRDGGDRQFRVSVKHDSNLLVERVSSMAKTSLTPDGNLLIVVSGQTQEAPEELNRRLRRVLELVDETGAELRSVETQERSLENLFLHLTGRSLRD